MTTQSHIVCAIVALAAVLGSEVLHYVRAPIGDPETVGPPTQAYKINHRRKRVPPIVDIGIEVVIQTKHITIGIRDKILGQKALNYLRLGAVRDDPTRTGRLRQKQNRKRVEQFRKSGSLYTANKDFQHINPTEVLPFAGPDTHGLWGRVGNMKVTFRTSSRSYPNQATIEMVDFTANAKKAVTYKFRYNNIVRGNQRRPLLQ